MFMSIMLRLCLAIVFVPPSSIMPLLFLSPPTEHTFLPRRWHLFPRPPPLLSWASARTVQLFP